jgi:glycosyltransferase involved in cell wall biosynthesis
MMHTHDERLILYSRLAFYPMHWEAFKYLCAHYAVQGTIIANSPPGLPTVHQQLGWASPQHEHSDIDVRLMPQTNALAKSFWLRQQLGSIRPDVIWAQEEPTDLYLMVILGLYRLDRRTRIVTAVCENIFDHWQIRWLRPLWRFLWSRLDGLLGIATASLEGIWAVGMPKKIPALTLVAGALPPPEHVEPMPLPFTRAVNDFVVGFAGRVCEEKGWKVLLTALQSLPPNYKCVLAGDGPQLDELRAWMDRPELQGRVFYVGLLPRDALLSFYRALDCLAIPSLTFPRWKEQFGGVLADGMAMGLPLIGSDSGAIPEVIGPAGLAVPENNPHALAAAIRQLREQPDLRQKFAEAGRKRFEAEFAIPAYARKIALGLRLKERSK